MLQRLLLKRYVETAVPAAVLLEGILAPVFHRSPCMTCFLAPAALPVSAKAA